MKLLCYLRDVILASTLVAVAIYLCGAFTYMDWSLTSWQRDDRGFFTFFWLITSGLYCRQYFWRHYYHQYGDA